MRRYWTPTTLGSYDCPFLGATAAKPKGKLDFDHAILATWNPALLVVDAIQITGHSEIIKTFRRLEPRIRHALAGYPIASYGAAWLDEFGIGRLIPRAGKPALERLQSVLAQPRLLGLGLCSLSAHVDKARPDLPCLEAVESVTLGCAPSDLEAIFDMLNQLGLLSPLLEGHPAATAVLSPLSGSTGGDGTGGITSLAYFENPLQDLLSDLCDQLNTAKSQGLGLPRRTGPLCQASCRLFGGCGPELVAASL